MVAFVALCAHPAVARQMTIGDVKQEAKCAVAGVQGNVTVNCPSGVPRSTVRLLNKQFAARLKDREARIAELTGEVNEWKDRFDKLTARLEMPGMDEELRRQADKLLRAGKLEEAGQILDKILESGEEELEQLARVHFDRASLFELQSEPLWALPHYEKALSYRPNNPDYAEAYGQILCAEHDYQKAEPLLTQAVGAYSDMAKTNPQAYLPDVGRALNNLGNLYRDTQRLTESADAYSEALQIGRTLAKASPQIYLPAAGSDEIALSSWSDESSPTSVGSRAL